MDPEESEKFAEQQESLSRRLFPSVWEEIDKAILYFQEGRRLSSKITYGKVKSLVDEAIKNTSSTEEKDAILYAKSYIHLMEYSQTEHLL